MADSGGGVINPNPSAGRVLGAAEEDIGEGGVAPIYPSDGEGVLFSYKFVRMLLALTSKVAVGELVAIEVLMYTTIWSIKDGEREARQASNMDFIGGEARGGANRVLIGVFDMGEMDVPVVLVFVTDHG